MDSEGPASQSWNSSLDSAEPVVLLQRQVEVLRLSLIAVQRRRDADCADLLEAITHIHFRLDRLAERVLVLEAQLSLLQGQPESTDSVPAPSFFNQLD